MSLKTTRGRVAIGALLLVLCAAVWLALSLGSKPAGADDTSDALDGTWTMHAQVINGSAVQLPLYEQFTYTVDTSESYMLRRVLDTYSELEHTDAQLESSAVTFRGASDWTTQDTNEMIAAGLDPNEQDGILEMECASGVTLRLAYHVYAITGGTEASLVRIYQSGAWSLPETNLYGPVQAGSSGVNIVGTVSNVAKTLTCMVWRK